MGGGPMFPYVSPAERQQRLEHEEKMLAIELEKNELSLKAYEAEVKNTLKDLERERELDEEKLKTAMMEEEARQASFKKEMNYSPGHEECDCRPSSDFDPRKIVNYTHPPDENLNTDKVEGSDGLMNSNGLSSDKNCGCGASSAEMTQYEDRDNSTVLDTFDAADEEDNPSITAELGEDGNWTFDINNVSADGLRLTRESDTADFTGMSEESSPGSPNSIQWHSLLSHLFNGHESNSQTDLDEGKSSYSK